MYYGNMRDTIPARTLFSNPILYCKQFGRHFVEFT